ncbi:aminoglycoside phosphotransferase family protein [Rhodosalinus sp.]|uniref:aminoglycoside phosphotransferase family protein n=1 Tax=Rhodosalinus sp. TaxID=2047741 RepID=UPI0035622136
MTREAAHRAFLSVAGWAEADTAPLAGDASARRYLRLTRHDGARAVLMDADPATGEDVRPFRRVAEFLRGAGLSAPEVLAADDIAGFLLLEDLGDALVARAAEERPATEPALYAAAGETLAALQRHAPPADWPRATPGSLAKAVAPLFTHYAPDLGGVRQTATEAALREALEALPREAPAPVLRDFHAENLVWLPERAGPARLGLLDFQDAVAGHPAYDLASLTRDARRDVSPEAAEAALAAWLAATGRARAETAAAMALLAVQRNLRILGIFARLAEAGKPRYLALMPRVWRQLQADLAHPAAADVARALADLPAPRDAA